MKRLLALSYFALAGLCVADPGPHTGPFGPGGTWNVYQLIEHSISWEDARKEAETLPPPVGDPAAKGHLVTFSSAAENQFVRLINRSQAWCGLTDNERFGGHEAGSKFRDGWKWCDGEPLTFINWIPNQPDEWLGEGAGEDAVFFDSTGRWADNGMGAEGQHAGHFYYVAEWETHSPTPVPGAFAMPKVWPDKPVMPEYVAGKWNVRWVLGYLKWPGGNWIEAPRIIADGSSLLLSAADAVGARAQPLIQDEGKATASLPWLWFTTEDGNRTGWLIASDGQANIPQLPQRDPYIAAVVGKIRVEKAGVYSFAVSARDAFALRIDGLKWKTAVGDGYIDPLDPLTFTQPDGSFATKAIGVMDLPAGDHQVEAMWMVEHTQSEFNVLSAPGEHLVLGETGDWRPLGHSRESGKIPWLGVSEAGWKVECSLGDGKNLSLQDGLAKLELDLERITKSGVAAINFAESPEATRFPGALQFPNDRPDVIQEHWPLRATAKLVVPQDGVYQIGMRAIGFGALRIKGGVLQGITQGGQLGGDFHRRPDMFDFNGQADLNNEAVISTTWELKKGEYEIEVFYVRNEGPPALALCSAPAGPYPMTLLARDGGGLVDDAQGLPHAEPYEPVATGEPARPVVRSHTPMMDVLTFEVLKGEPINPDQGKQVADYEFGELWDHKIRFPANPGESEPDRRGRALAEIYLCTLKRYFIDPEMNGGWPVGFGNLKEEGVPQRMLDALKRKADEPMTKVQRTMVSFAMVVPAIITGDEDAIAQADRQLAADWPADSVIVRRVASLKTWARSSFLKNHTGGFGPVNH